MATKKTAKEKQAAFVENEVADLFVEITSAHGGFENCAYCKSEITTTIKRAIAFGKRQPRSVKVTL